MSLELFDPLEDGLLEPVPLEDVSLEPAPLDDVSPEPVPLELEEPVLLWCFELFFLCVEEELEPLDPLASSLLAPERPVAVPDVSDEPVEPLMPPVVPVEPEEPEVEPDEPIEPPAPELVSLGLVEPVLDGALAPPAPVPLADAPDELMSIILAVSPESEARTCAPSLMSERLACEPSLVIFVLRSTLTFLSLPASERVLLSRSNFSTLPWIVSSWPDAEDDELGSLDAEADEPVPIELDEPELDGDEAPLESDEPVLEEPFPILPEELEPPIEPWLESRLVLLVLGELELPLVLLPLLWARACAATSAMAAARPRPHPVFFM